MFGYTYDQILSELRTKCCRMVECFLANQISGAVRVIQAFGAFVCRIDDGDNLNRLSCTPVHQKVFVGLCASCSVTFRKFIPSSSLKHSAVFLLVSASPLFEEKRHGRPHALVFQIDNPSRLHGARLGA